MERNRKRIDEINKKLNELLEERFILTKEIGDYKKNNNLPIENIQRENEILNKINGIYADYKKDIFKQIFNLSKKQQNEKKSIILIGMPMSGKTIIGKKLAENLNMNFLDTDEYIENKFSMTINEIFQKYGENFFRTEEKKLCEKLPNGFVISCGGGLILSEENRKKIKESGTVILLKRKFDKKENEINKRPLLKNTDYYDLWKERKEIYETLSDFTVDNNNSIENSVNIIKNHL